MSGKRNSIGEPKDKGSKDAESKKSSKSSKTASEQVDDKEIVKCKVEIGSTSSEEQPTPLQSQQDPCSSSTLQLVPVHITQTDYHNTQTGYTPQSSSSSSVDSQYKYYGDNRGGGSGGVGPHHHNHHQHHHNRYNQFRQPGPTIPIEQMNMNIKRNLEHRELQKRQEYENILRNNNEANQFLARGSVIIRMRGLPYECSAKQVVDFFESAPNNVKLLDNEDGVLFVRKSDGRPTGDAFVMLICEEDVPKALQKHKNSIGSRYIELFRSTAAEVMNRSMDIRLLDQQQQPQALAPLISHLPTMAPMIPQQSVAQGPRKDCIRLRGLPYDAQIDHILNFLGDYSKCILYQGVHMVYTPQGQPSGEAFIQMSNESSAWSATKNRHKCMMGYGKKSRYVEVFQCSGDDMNYVLSGAAAPANPSGVPSVQPARPIVSTSGMLMWENGPPTAGPPPPLMLPSPATPQTPHLPPPTLHHPSLPPPPPMPSAVAAAAASYMQQSPAAAAAAAAAVAAAAAAAGMRPPFPAGLAGVTHSLIPPPTNGMAMVPQIHPSMKQPPHVLLPQQLTATPRPPLEVSMPQVSHCLPQIKNTISSATGYQHMFSYPTVSSAAHTPTNIAPAQAMYLIPGHNSKLPTPLASMPSQMQMFQTFPTPHTPTQSSNLTEPSGTSKSQIHLLPTPYQTSIPNSQRRASQTSATQSVTSKRSYDQAFNTDRNSTSSHNNNSAGGSASKRMTPSTSHLSSPPTPSIPHHAPPLLPQAAHFQSPLLPQYATIAGQAPLNPGILHPHLNPVAAAVAAPMFQALYQQPMYHPMYTPQN